MARPSAPAQTAVDYVTIVLSPALIIGLVGSLVFFLLEVFYQPDAKGADWRDRLQWILFFFVFGAVLTARISMNAEIARRFWMYGSILALLTYVGMAHFVEYPPGVKDVSFIVNAFLVAVTWWCAHRLTWDCTNVDEDVDMSGEGVLQAAGLEGEAAEEPVDESKTLWQRWQEYQERSGKKRTLGVWVVYFSLAALPIFGLGQALIPLTSPERRRFTFWLMTVYVGCGLGLLLTTCFLGLRRYLRQKRLQMPSSMTAAWLTTGGGLIVALLLIGALLPRPYAEYSVLDIVNPAGARKREASRLAMKGGTPGEGKGQPGAADPEGKDAGGKTGKDGKDKGPDKDGKNPGGKEEGKNASSGDKDKGDQGKGEQSKDGEKGGPKDKGEPKDGQQGKKEEGGKGGKQAEPPKGMKDMEKGAQQAQQSSSSPLNKVQEFLQRVGPWLKWIVFALLAIVVLVALLRGGLGWLANFSSWAKGLLEAWRKFWENLFGGAKAASEAEEEAEAAARGAEPAPFSAYRNPFDDGRAEQMSPRQLVRYTFDALQAWARERGFARREDETAVEFAARLGEEVPGLAAEARRLALLHGRAEYADGALPAATNDALRAFWERLERVAAAPLSA